ncbi:MAG TPA: DUF4956 domain-containing protein [Flavobacteriales bacterium]|nr:DUF4956 domain-containing protein [Flavobacteriales bacterium]
MNDNTSIGDVISINELINPNMTQLDLIPTLFSFFMCVIMSFIVRDFYIKRSFSLTGKMHIGSIIPVLSAVVFLVIIVVKSSLALSLGLVGALSIVRFRTPIKEPEELVYLFLAIAIGLGYAAGQILITTILSLSILFIVYMWLSNRKIAKTSEYNLVVKWTKVDIMFEDILKEITPIVENLKLVRLDKNSSSNTAVMLVVPNEKRPVETIANKLHILDDSMNVTFFEAKTNW